MLESSSVWWLHMMVTALPQADCSACSALDPRQTGDHYPCSEGPTEPISVDLRIYSSLPAALLQSKDLHELKAPSTFPTLACEGAGGSPGPGQEAGLRCGRAGLGWGCPTQASVLLLGAAFSNPALICLTQGHLRRWFILGENQFF